jgi:hypothetical protein
MVTFIQHQIPGLEDGDYQLTVSQRIIKDAKEVSDPSLTNTYKFAVLGDRFSLSNPVKAVSSVFPPDGGTGKFTTVLPHVVFTAPTFPWARFPTKTPPFTPPPPGQDTEADVPTWLAVLVFDEDDVGAFPGLKLPPATARVGDLFPPEVVEGSTLGGNYSYFWEAKDLRGLEADETVEDKIEVLDVPLKLFWQVAPTIADLRLTAHVRQVNLLNKPTGQGPDPLAPLGTFSIVFGARLPQTQKKAFAYLVSLEKLQDFLPTDEQGGPPPGVFHEDAYLRMAVLTSWTFFSTGESATFVDGLLELNGRDDPEGPTDAVNTDLRLLYSGSNPVVEGALKMGYVPLNETLRTAGRTVSWYRGPCAPYSITKPGIKLPIASPDQATVFDPTTGMFDLSYAAAWTLGRMLALQDTAFSTELYNWKKGQMQLAIKAVEDQILSQHFSGVLTAGAAPRALRNGKSPSTSRALMMKTIQALKPRE